MAYEQKPGSGSLFRNKRKEEGDKRPNLTGKALLQVGDQLVEVELSGWTRESERAGKWISLSVRAKHVRPLDDVDLLDDERY